MIGMFLSSVALLNVKSILTVIFVSKDVAGVSHRGELGTLLVKISLSSLPMSTVSTSLPVRTNLLWRVISGNITDRLSRSSQHPTTATDVVTRLQLWKLTTRWTSAKRKLFMTTVNCKWCTCGKEVLLVR